MNSRYNWLIKYKLYHIPFWLAYHIFWWTITIGSLSAVFQNILHSPYAIKFLFYVIFEALGVYFNLYFLMPRFLEKGKYVQYILFVVATIICVAALIVPGYYISANIAGKTFDELYQNYQNSYAYLFKINTLPSAAASMTLGMCVKLTKNWVQTKKRQQLLEKEKLETELQFLKSQLNPHFLFNSINSIFVLIHKNPDVASEALAKFSDLLRYQLYECNDAKIPLQQELDYIENFISLEKLRQEQSLKLQVNIPDMSKGNLTIAPFILMPFVENVFKHVSRQKDNFNYIHIQLRLEEDVLFFETENNYSPYYTNSTLSGKGIGLKNIQRRLELLYPNRHELSIIQTDEVFKIVLHLKLIETVTLNWKQSKNSCLLNNT